MTKKLVALMLALSLALGLCISIGNEAKAADEIPIYRVYNPNSGEHLFTSDSNEANVLSTKTGWRYEGCSWNSPASGTPVYRLYQPKKFHLYTSDENEIKELTTKAGWKADNNGAPVFYSGGSVEIYRLYHPKTTRHLLTSDKHEYEVLSGKDWNGEGVGLNASSIPDPATVQSPIATQNLSYGYVKGVWISFLEWQSYLKGKNEAQFRQAFNQMCNTAVNNKCNTVYVHVRSHNDAVYPSGIYPWSTEMLAGVPSYNPLSIMIDIAHSKGLSFHAWINPYGYRNGQISGDPALATKENIIGGIREIVSQYNVDGIHFDDYFPSYDKSVHNQMIREAYSTAHAYGKVFGVSPQGNIDNNRAAGVDVDTWLSVPGYVDYLAPQIYWTDQYGPDKNVTMYSDRLSAWTSLNKLNLPMYVGLATYRTGTAYPNDDGWLLTDNNLATQIQKANAAGWDGYIHFRYAHLTTPNAQRELANIR